MKKLIAVLFVLLAVQSYGVYGRSQADRIMYSCEIEVGPLCYQWEENALAKILGGSDNAAELEKKLGDLKEAWDEQFIARVEEATRQKTELEKALDAAHDRASKKLNRAADKVKQVLEALEE